MITVEDVLFLHTKSIEFYGGSDGLRDQGLLESAISRPYQTFDNEYLYPDIFTKAAAILESIVINHPFIDGNKRTRFLAMFALLRQENYKLSATEEQAYDFTIKVSKGAIDFEEIVNWIRSYAITIIAK